MKFFIKHKSVSLFAGLMLSGVLSGCATIETTVPTAPPPPVAQPQPVPTPPVTQPALRPTGPIVVMPVPEPASTTVLDSPAEKEFSEGQNMYESGDYKGAQRRLSSAANTLNDSSPNKQASMKLLAFTFCLTNQKLQCRKQFNTLLALNPKFELTKSEAGHPLWGPVFVQAKKEQSTPKK